MLGRGPGIKTGVSWASLASAARAAFGDRDAGNSGAAGYVDAGEWVRRLAAGAGAGRSVLDVQRAFLDVAGSRGRKEKERILAELLSSASPDEAAWIARNAVGEMRTGAQEGLLVEAIAAAAGRPGDEIRRAMIGASDVAALAEAALTDSGARLAEMGIRVGAPVPPMLAESAETLGEAYDKLD